MNDRMLKRCKAIAEYIVESGDTVRGAAEIFGISKSTVHKDITERLGMLGNKALMDEVNAVLSKNWAEKHIRGGLATKQKYQKQK